MAVLPGCEAININDMSELQKCMQINLTEFLTDYLHDFLNKMEEMGITEASTRINFAISTEGKITDIKVMEDGNPEFSQATIIAMHKIADSIGYIEPAKIFNGDKTKHTFRIPININIQE